MTIDNEQVNKELENHTSDRRIFTFRDNSLSPNQRILIDV